MDTPNICWIVSKCSVPCFSFVGYKLCSNTVINKMGFSEEVVHELDNLLFQTKHGFTWVHTLLLKRVEYGVLETHHMCCIKILCSHQRLVFGDHCLENELRDRCSSKWQLLQKIIQIFFTQFIALQDSARWGDCPFWQQQWVFLALPLQWSHCLMWILATKIPRPYATWLFLWGFLKEKV